jgi:hypothetical protein
VYFITQRYIISNLLYSKYFLYLRNAGLRNASFKCRTGHIAQEWSASPVGNSWFNSQNHTHGKTTTTKNP